MEIINYNDKVNEIKMEDIIFHGPQIDNYDYLAISWKILNGCNYKCSYCFGQDILKKDFTPIGKLKSAVDKIFKIKKDYYTFNLLGGEVTYYPNFLELVKYIYSFDAKISILLITNASKNINYFDELLSYVGNNEFTMHFSVHFEYADIDHIKNLIKLFNKHKHIINIDFMLHPNYREKIQFFFNDIIDMKKDYFFNFSLTELREPPDFVKIDSRYDQDFYNWIDNARKIIENTKSNVPAFTRKFILFPNSYFILKEKNNLIKNINIEHNIALRNNLKQFKNFYCCGGINLLRIENDGRYSGGVCWQFPIIGNIYDDEDIDLYKLSKYVKCNLYQCGCSTNDRINKYRDINEAEKYTLSYIIKKYPNIIKKYPEVMMEYMLNTIEELKNQVASNNKINNIDNKIDKLVDSLAWWIPFKKKRDEFRKKFDI